MKITRAERNILLKAMGVLINNQQDSRDYTELITKIQEEEITPFKCPNCGEEVD